jgi:SAM-dependent methyltransferase
MDYLSSGFSKVDRAQNPDVYLSCLQTLSSLPYFQEYKKKSIMRLDLKKDSKMLEIGCGLGRDAIAISELIGEHGSVSAIDSSRRMVESARKGDGRNRVNYCLADACRLPFSGGVFDGARADRVLQHISEPEKAFSEMVRVVKDRGRIAVYEPDWGTFIVSPGKKEISRIMTQLFGDTFPSGWIGRQLPGYFHWVGLKDVRIDAETFYTDDLDLAIQVFDLVNNANRSEKMGYVSKSQKDDWLEELLKAYSQGRFFCSYTGFLVSGVKSLE